MIPTDLESMRTLFSDNRTHLSIAKILQLSLVSDRSALKVLVEIWPEQRQVIARMAWEDAGPESGIFSFPAVNDLVIVAFTDGDDDTAFVIRRLTSKEEKIPVNAVDGSMVLKSRDGKKVWITSSNKILLSKGDSAPTENLVLGQQLKALLVSILGDLKDLATKISTHTHAGNLGFPTSIPTQTADFVTLSTAFDNLKSSPVNDNAILSDFAFTEKGS